MNTRIEMDEENCDDIVEPIHAFLKLCEFEVMHFKHSCQFFGQSSISLEKIWCLGIRNVLHIDQALDFELLIANRWFN